jgi:hypothetical protein
MLKWIPSAPLAALALFAQFSPASTFFVDPVKPEQGARRDAQLTTEIVRDTVQGQDPAQLAGDKIKADFVLKPAITRLGAAYLIKVEKLEKGKVVALGQGKARNVEDLDVAARKATEEAIAGPKSLTPPVATAPAPAPLDRELEPDEPTIPREKGPEPPPLLNPNMPTPPSTTGEPHP